MVSATERKSGRHGLEAWAAGEVGCGWLNTVTTERSVATAAREAMTMMPTSSHALTGSTVGALGTAGDISTAAIAIRTANASRPSTRR